MPEGARRLDEPSARFLEAAEQLGDEFGKRLASVELLEEAFADAGAGPVEERPGAAVLLPVVGGRSAKDPARLVLIRRATHLRANPGEIAFAGGRLEPGESAEEAALRETREEIMLEPGSVRVLGRLPIVYRVTRSEGIAPFVATVEGWPSMTPSPAEVDDLVVVPLAELADPERYFEESWPMGGGEFRLMHFFELDDDLVWGASARILALLLDRLAEAVLQG